MKIRLNVTARDIRLSEEQKKARKDYLSSTDCPIARALHRHAGHERWAVGQTLVHSCNGSQEYGEYGGILPPDAVEFVKHFDYDEPVGPFSFILTVGGEG